MAKITVEEVKTLEVRAQVNAGKSKVIYATNMNGVFLMTMKPHLRSLTYKREGDIKGTDYWRLFNCLGFFRRFESYRIPTNLLYNKIVKIREDYYLVVGEVQPFEVEFIYRSRAAGSIVREMPTLVRPGQFFPNGLLKFSYKQDVRHGVDDPTINEDYIVELGLMKRRQLNTAKAILRSTGNITRDSIARCHKDFFDFKTEIGITPHGRIVLMDEVSQDCIRATESIIVDHQLTPDDFVNMEDKMTPRLIAQCIENNILVRSVTKDLWREGRTEEEVLEGYKRFALALDPEIQSMVTIVS